MIGKSLLYVACFVLAVACKTRFIDQETDRMLNETIDFRGVL